jgi:tetratricopeptide (TPR) repeat protein
MTFKKTTFLTLALLVSVAVFGQKSKRTSANNYMGYGELDNAMEAIEPTITDEKTMNEAKTWFFRGQIYQAIYETQDEKYKSLHPNPLQIAVESFLKCIELDDKDYYKGGLGDPNSAYRYLNVEGQQFVNEGITRYNGKDYASALTAFENTIKISGLEPIKRTDSLAIYYAGASAEMTGDLAKAEKYYRQSIGIGYKAELAYVRMERMYAGAGQADKAFEILKEGRSAFPNNQTMVTDEVNVYLQKDQHADAMKALEVALQGEPDNASLHFAYGFVNDRLAAKEIEANPKGNEAYDGYIAAAEKSYSKAVELDGENFDAVYNLGALYFNQAVKMQEAANLIDDMKKYEAAKAEADAVFDKSMPILEKAYSLNSEDKGVLISLKQLYYRKMAEDTSYKEKYDKIMSKIKG